MSSLSSVSGANNSNLLSALNQLMSNLAAYTNTNSDGNSAQSLLSGVNNLAGSGGSYVPQLGSSIPTDYPLPGQSNGMTLSTMHNQIGTMIAQTGGLSYGSGASGGSSPTSVLAQNTQTGSAASQQQASVTMQMAGLNGSNGIFSGNPLLNQTVTSSLGQNAGLVFEPDSAIVQVMNASTLAGQQIDSIATGTANPSSLLNGNLQLDQSIISSLPQGILPADILQGLSTKNNLATQLQQQAATTTPAALSTATTSSTSTTATNTLYSNYLNSLNTSGTSGSTSTTL